MRTRDLCIMAMLVAVLTGAKTALAFLPNIEIVTLLLIVYALSLGLRRSLIITFVFVLIECFIWGFGFWVVLYFIYWPLLVTAVSLLPKIKNRVFLAVAVGIGFTFLFGVLSTGIEITFMGALGSGRFLQYFYFRYISGIGFFLTHIVSNAIILSLLVPIFYGAFKRLYKYA